MSGVRTLVYCTSNQFKIAEGTRILDAYSTQLSSGVSVKLSDRFAFDIHRVPTSEPMECDMEKMIAEKVKSAYSSLMVPCILEYAGLIFKDCAQKNFPGGLTQSIWNALDADRFITDFARAGRPVIARAVVGYCDGRAVLTFIGETEGTISNSPRGTRHYDWDTVFCPSGERGQTYAEIADNPTLGIDHKVKLSQSTKAFLNLFRYLIEKNEIDAFF